MNILKKLKNKLKETKGFTLIELVVVVALIGILSGVAVPKYLGFQEDAREKNDIAIARQIADITTMAYATEKVTLKALSDGFQVNLDDAGKALPTDTSTITASQVVLSFLEANHPSLKSSKVIAKDATGKKLFVKMDAANNNAITVYVGDDAGTPNNMLYPTARILGVSPVTGS